MSDDECDAGLAAAGQMLAAIATALKGAVELSVVMSLDDDWPSHRGVVYRVTFCSVGRDYCVSYLATLDALRTADRATWAANVRRNIEEHIRASVADLVTWPFCPAPMAARSTSGPKYRKTLVGFSYDFRAD